MLRVLNTVWAIYLGYLALVALLQPSEENTAQVVITLILFAWITFLIAFVDGWHVDNWYGEESTTGEEEMLIEITERNWVEKVSNSSTPILVCFSANWCGACQRLHPVLERLSEEYASKATIGVVNVDRDRNLARKWGVRPIPTMLFFQPYSPHPVKTEVGYRRMDELEEILDEILRMEERVDCSYIDEVASTQEEVPGD